MKQKLKELEEEAAKLRNTQVSTSSGTSASYTSQPCYHSSPAQSKVTHNSTVSRSSCNMPQYKAFYSCWCSVNNTPCFAHRTVSLVEEC
jgi:hypothetical protein